jgi:pilus assembly protein Flp/PilA
MAELLSCVRQFAAEDDGATMVEYGLMLTFVALACVALVSLLGQSLKTPFQTVISGI